MAPPGGDDFPGAILLAGDTAGVTGKSFRQPKLRATCLVSDSLRGPMGVSSCRFAHRWVVARPPDRATILSAAVFS